MEVKQKLEKSFERIAKHSIAQLNSTHGMNKVKEFLNQRIISVDGREVKIHRTHVIINEFTHKFSTHCSVDGQKFVCRYEA